MPDVPRKGDRVLLFGSIATVTNVSRRNGWVYIRLADRTVTWLRIELLRLETLLPRAWRYAP